MANINQVTLIGYLGQDPKISSTQSGVKVGRLSVGTTERGYTTKQGTKVEDRTEWHDVVVWRHSAEFAEKYCRKGSQVYVQGKLRHRTYQDQQQQTRYVTEIEAEVFELLDRAQQSQQQAQQPTQQYNAAPVTQNTAQMPPFGSAPFDNTKKDGDLPF